MFHKIFKKKFFIALHSKAPYTKERSVYLDYWQKHGMSLLGLKRIADFLLIIVNNLKLNSKKLISTKEIDKTFEQLVYQARNRKKGKTLLLYSKKSCSGHAKKWLKMIGRLNDVTKPDYPFSNKLLSFENYQRREKGLAEGSINTASSIIKIFLKYFSKKKFLSEIFVHKILMIFLFIKKTLTTLDALFKAMYQQFVAF